MFLYLDDIRDPINNNFHVVRNYQDCIDMIKNNTVHFLSLDHDLGEEKTGYDVAKYLAQEGIEVEQINIHSQNPVGRDNIIQLIDRYFPETKISCKTKI